MSHRSQSSFRPSAWSLVLATLAAACAADDGDVDDDFRGQGVGYGPVLANGLALGDGLELEDGTNLATGLAVGTGLDVAFGLGTPQGLSGNQGLMVSEEGQELVSAIVECALRPTQSITKLDPVHAGFRTFWGLHGLAPWWRSGACDANCQSRVSACLLARSNADHDAIAVDMRSTMKPLGTAASGPQFIVQEGAFWGNLFANPPRAYACKGVDASIGLFESRTCADGGDCVLEGLEDHCRDTCQTTGAAGSGPGVFANCEVDGVAHSNIVTTYLDPTPFSGACPPGCDACHDGVCTMFCSDEDSCAAQQLHCPPGVACEVLCDGPGACKATIVDCGHAETCAVTCTGGGACSSTRVKCTDGDCELVCEGWGNCTQAMFWLAGTGTGAISCGFDEDPTAVVAGVPITTSC